MKRRSADPGRGTGVGQIRNNESDARSGGGIGRHAVLRGQWRKPCEFESRPEHQNRIGLMLLLQRQADFSGARRAAGFRKRNNPNYGLYSRLATLIQSRADSSCDIQPPYKQAKMLQEYLPILIFLGISTGIGLVLLALGFLIGQGTEGCGKAVALRVRLRSFRRFAHEVRCSLLPRRHSVHYFRSRNRFSFPVGRVARRGRKIRPACDGVVSRDSGRRFHLRMEERGARVGLADTTATPVSERC